MGISISYDWCLSICDQFVISIFKKYDDNKVFVHTAIASSYYHGIIFSIMQFLTTMNCGVLQEKPYNLSENSKSKLALPIFCLRLTLNSNHFHFNQAPFSLLPYLYVKCCGGYRRRLNVKRNFKWGNGLIKERLCLQHWYLLFLV